MRKRYMRTSRYFHDGGSHHGNTMLPQSLVNLGRNIQYNIEDTWSSFTGAQSRVNPSPLVQPINK